MKQNSKDCMIKFTLKESQNEFLKDLEYTYKGHKKCYIAQ